MANFLRSKLSGRKDISIEEFDFIAEEAGDGMYPKVTYKGFKNSDGLEDSARVIIRLTHRRNSMSVDCGTVGKPSVIDGKAFETFPMGSFKCSFRVVRTEKNASKGKVLGSTRHKKIVLDKKNLEEEGLLNFKFNQDLDPLLWRLDFDDEKGPLLEVDKNCPDARQLFHNDLTLQVAIVPTVITRVLEEVYEGGVREHTGWRQIWNKWAISTAEEEPPVDNTDLGDWIEKVVEKQMHQKALLKNFINSKEHTND
jgi:hypothetical protein